ncbi:MAG: HYR domain-containing protein, partial [Candidatus Binatia bacterium]
MGPLTTLYRSMLGIAVEDACDPAPTVGFAPGALPLGTTAVTATARDATGNTSSCTFPVTVVDTTPPVFLVCPDDMERHCEAGGALVAFD